jgi:C-terminal processing protease CtpA/Prc
VNGRELNTTSEVYGYFEGTAGRSVVIKVGPNAEGTGARDITVVPVESETNLRHFAWIEGNRRIAIYGLNGEWEVENIGIAPDIEVELDPKQMREGHDPQLEKSVDVLLDQLKKNPLPKYRKPSYPNYHSQK